MSETLCFKNDLALEAGLRITLLLDTQGIWE